MEISQAIFKSYDIRGIYPEELNADAAYKIGRSFIEYTKAKKVAVGRDSRTSSPDLFLELVKGITDEGAVVYDIGQVPTECLYFSVGNYDFDAGIMITASHNSKEYNGMKMLQRKGGNIVIIRGKDLLSEIKKEDLAKSRGANALSLARQFNQIDIWKDYLKRILSFIGEKEIKNFKVIVDASNGVAGLAISEIKRNLPVEIISLNFNPDGNFPNHSPNPLLEGSIDQLRERVKKEKADFGFIFDGDADRIFLMDERGQIVRADTTLLLLAKYFLKKNPGAAIAYNAICSKAAPEFIKKWGGRPVRTQVGFVNVREGLLKNDGIMGGELSGHYCFRDYFYLDSGMISFLILLQIISHDNKKVSELVRELSPYAKSPEISFEIENKEEILNKIKEKYSDGKQDYLDGVTVEYKDWWFNVRPSNTEPLLRLTIEADTQDILEQKEKELRSFING